MRLEHVAGLAFRLGKRAGQFVPDLGGKPHGGKGAQLAQFGLAQLARPLVGARDALGDFVFLAPDVAQRIVERAHGLGSAYTHCRLTIG